MALIASVVVVWLAVMALLRSNSRDDDRGDRGGGGYGYYSSGPRVGMFMDMTDLLYFWDPYYYRCAGRRGLPARGVAPELHQGLNDLYTAGPTGRWEQHARSRCWGRALARMQQQQYYLTAVLCCARERIPSPPLRSPSPVALRRTSAERVASGTPLNFVESIFSFVFGDGDPNMNWEERRWRRLGEMIQAKWVASTGRHGVRVHNSLAF